MALTRVQPAMLSAGAVIQVWRLDWTNQTSLGNASNAFQDFAGSSLTVQAKYASSKFLVICDLQVHLYNANGGGNGFTIRIARDGVNQTTDGNLHETYQNFPATVMDWYMRMPKSCFVAAGNTNPTTFKVQGALYSGSPTLTCNTGNFSSNMTIFEIAA